MPWTDFLSHQYIMQSSTDIKLKKYIVNPCEECTHILYDDTGEAVIIDCGVFHKGERQRLLEYLKEENLRPVRLLLTHAHHDHLYGNDLILEHYGLLPEVHVADGPLMGAHLMNRINECYNGNYPYSIPMPEHYLNDGDIITFGHHELRVIHTPGHSPGSVIFYCEQAGMAFTGDTLFRRDIGATNLPFGSFEEIMSSLDYITQLLPDDTVIYPGHGGKSTIGYEKEKNPHLNGGIYY